MWNFFQGMAPLFNSIISWYKSAAVCIRSYPFLLFTVGFVVLGYVIAILGRLLSKE